MLKIIDVKSQKLIKKGLNTNCSILSINNHKVEDILDLYFNVSHKNILIVKNTCEEKKISLKSSDFDDLDFEPIRAKHCGCKCIFCFVDQLPKGLRDTLYVKDEDYRLSYLSGNYVTLANLKENDYKKIIEYRLSPLYVSVHATDPYVRASMLGLKKPSHIMEILKKLSENRIITHCQIVLCPGINDGNVLRKTIEDLASLYPYVETVAIVPVGLTKHRRGLKKLHAITKIESEKIFELVIPYQKKFFKQYKTPFVFLSDEFYILSGKRVSQANFYGDFAQIENGVGLLRSFLDDAKKLLNSKSLKKTVLNGKTGVITGTLVFKRIKKIVEKLGKSIECKLELIPVENSFFGKTVSVTGLITAYDIEKTLKGRNFSRIFVPDVMLRYRKDYFLDDVSLKDLSKKISARVYKFNPTLTGLYKALQKAAKKEDVKDGIK